MTEPNCTLYFFVIIAEKKSCVKKYKSVISNSQKRQITIPQKFCTHFHFDSQAKISTTDNDILIQPAENLSNSEFDVQILQDLVQLVQKVLAIRNLLMLSRKAGLKVRSAVEAMLLNAKRIAHAKLNLTLL